MKLNYFFQLEIHSMNECKIFRKAKFEIKLLNYNEHHPIYESILTLRCLCLKEQDPKKWDRLNTMEHHNSMRQKSIDTWNRNQINVVKFLRERCQMTEFDDMAIHSVIGYSDINTFEIKTTTTQ